MNISLYQISEELRLAMEKVFDNEGEITEEIEKEMAQIETMLMSKTDNIVEWVEYQEDLLKLIYDKNKQLSDLKKKIEKRMESFDSYVEGCLIKLDKKLINGSTRTIKLRAKSDVVTIVNENEIPLEYITTTTSSTVDKAEIKKTLKKGAEVPGAILTKSTKASVTYGWRS